MAEQANLYSEYSHRLQVKCGLEMLKPSLRDGMHLLDVGCGAGNLSLYVLDLIGVNGSLFGIDPDKHRIDLAKEKSKDRPNATFVCLKGSDIPLEKEGLFDFAFSSVVLHWMDEQEISATINRVSRALKPGGLFVVQYLEIIPPFLQKMLLFLGKEHHEKLENRWYHRSLNDLCKLGSYSGFKVVHSESFDYETMWENFGELMTFLTASTGAVVDFRKVENKLAEEGREILESLMINGAVRYVVPTHRLTFRRPEY